MLVKKNHLPPSIQYHPIQSHLAKRGKLLFFWVFFFVNWFFPHLPIFAEFSASYLYISPFVSVFLCGKNNHPTSVGRFYIETSSLQTSCSSNRFMACCLLDHVFLGQCFWEWRLLSSKMFKCFFACETVFLEVKMMVILVWNYHFYKMKPCIHADLEAELVLKPISQELITSLASI